MKRKSAPWLAVLAGIVAAFTHGVSSAEPSGLLVVRAADSTLWKATCDGAACSAFTNFPGLFAAQPTVFWDENIQQYVVIGRASDSTIWRASFSRAGVFNNNWTLLPGLTSSPVGAAGGGIVNTFNANNGSMTLVPLSTTVANIRSLAVTVPFDGFVVCRGSGTVEHSRTNDGANAFSRIYLTTTSAGTAANWQFTDLPAAAPAGITSFPFTAQQWFSVAAGSDTYYMTGEAVGSTTTTGVRNASMVCNYHPYAF